MVNPKSAANRNYGFNNLYIDEIHLKEYLQNSIQDTSFSSNATQEADYVITKEPGEVRVQDEDKTHSKENKSRPYVIPNPTQGIFSIHPVEEDGYYKIYNEFGQLLDEGTLKSTYDISTHSNGLYLLMIQTRHTTRMIKILKQE